MEYFDRSNLGEANPIEFGPRAKLIRCCRPNGIGLKILFTELNEFHPIISQVLVCIDFSGSFNSNRDNILEKLRQRLKLGYRTNVATECICFAGSAKIVGNFDRWLNAELYSGLSAGGLVGGTASAPLISTISEFNDKNPLSEVLLVTDGELDIPVERLITRIHDELSISTTLVTS